MSGESLKIHNESLQTRCEICHKVADSYTEGKCDKCLSINPETVIMDKRIDDLRREDAIKKEEIAKRNTRANEMKECAIILSRYQGISETTLTRAMEQDQDFLQALFKKTKDVVEQKMAILDKEISQLEDTTDSRAKKVQLYTMLASLPLIALIIAGFSQTIVGILVALVFGPVFILAHKVINQREKIVRLKRERRGYQIDIYNMDA